MCARAEGVEALREPMLRDSTSCPQTSIMKKSIGDNMIPKDWGFERGLELVKRAGFDGIELWLGDVPWFQMATTDAAVRDLRRKIENVGLVVSNVSTGLHWASPLSARDPSARAQAATSSSAKSRPQVCSAPTRSWSSPGS